KETDAVSVTQENLTNFVDQPPWTSSRLFERTQPGVVMGLAWTAMGGAVIFVEAVGRSAEQGSSKPSKGDFKPTGGSLKVTGQLGGVMNESCEIAMTFSRGFIKKQNPNNNYLFESAIHLHVPEGATPKDGPSAGVTLASALLSLALNLNPKPDLAMTGELTLTGKVLKVGGIKEKVIAAKRENLKTLIFPRGNMRDFEELPPNVKEGLDVHFVDDYDQVFKIAFPQQLGAPQGAPQETPDEASQGAPEGVPKGAPNETPEGAPQGGPQEATPGTLGAPSTGSTVVGPQGPPPPPESTGGAPQGPPAAESPLGGPHGPSSPDSTEGAPEERGPLEGPQPEAASQ
ncbi:Lon protease homolog, mitochondrial, related, partial [Eimeria tenella]